MRGKRHELTIPNEHGRERPSQIIESLVELDDQFVVDGEGGPEDISALFFGVFSSFSGLLQA